MTVTAVYLGWRWYRSQQPGSSLWVSSVVQNQHYTFGNFTLAWSDKNSQWQLVYNQKQAALNNQLLWQSLPQQAFLQATINHNNQVIECPQQSIQQLYSRATLFQFAGQLACGDQLIPYQVEWLPITSDVLKLKLVVLHEQVKEIRWWLGSEQPHYQLSSQKVIPWQLQANMKASCRLPNQLKEKCLPDRIGGFHWPSGLTMWRLHPTNNASLVAMTGSDQGSQDKNGWWLLQPGNELELLLLKQPSAAASLQLLQQLALHPALQP